MLRFIASDGMEIAFADQGRGRPLVLLHGLMAHSGFFRDQDGLASDFRLICVDLRGHGLSRGDTAPSVEVLARDVAELAEALDLRDAVVVGWSLGASVLWRLLNGSAGDRFAGAVVIDMTPRVLNEDGWELGLTEELCEARRAAIAGDFENFAQAAGHAIFAQPVRRDLVSTADWAGWEFARNDSPAMSALWESLLVEDSRPFLRRIRQPTLIVHGAHSQLYGPGTAAHLAAALPNARIARFERSGHAPHLEEPELFNRTIREFAATLPQPVSQQTTA